MLIISTIDLSHFSICGIWLLQEINMLKLKFLKIGCSNSMVALFSLFDHCVREAILDFLSWNCGSTLETSHPDEPQKQLNAGEIQQQLK